MDEKLVNSVNNIRHYLDVGVKNGSYNLEDVNKIIIDFQAIIKFIQESSKQIDDLKNESKK